MYCAVGYPQTGYIRSQFPVADTALDSLLNPRRMRLLLLTLFIPSDLTGFSKNAGKYGQRRSFTERKQGANFSTNLSSHGPPLNTTTLHQNRRATVALLLLLMLLLDTEYFESQCSHLVVSRTVQEKNEHSL